MKTDDLKIIVDLMEVAGGNFKGVSVNDNTAYATNGVILASRGLTGIYDKMFFPKSNLPLIKALIASNKGSKEIDITVHNLTEFNDTFPNPEILESAFNDDFKFEIAVDISSIVSFAKAMKGAKNSRVVLKINEAKKPILLAHENGDALIAPLH